MEDKLDTIIDLLQQLVDKSKPQTYNKWSVEEEERFIEIYSQYDINTVREILADEFGHERTLGAIESRASRLGLDRG